MNKTVEDFVLFLNNIGFENDNEDKNCEIIELSLDYGNIKVRICSLSETYNIYIDLPYYDISQESYEAFNGDFNSDDEGLVENLLQDIYKYWLSKELYRRFKRKPDEEYDDHYMCPGSNLYLGYFDNEINNSTEDINLFIKVCKDYLPPYKSEENSIYHAITVTIIDFLKISGFKSIGSNLMCDAIGRIVIAPINATLEDYIYKNSFYKIDEIFYGKEYLLLRLNDVVSCVSKQSLLDYDNLTDILGWSFTETQFFFNKDSTIYFTNKLLHGYIKICPNADLYQDLEYMYIQDAFERFRNFRTTNKIELLDFSHLSANDFERLCYDFLIATGFENVHPVGNTNSPDGGKDLIANEIIQSRLGTEKRAILIQCKHSKTSLKRESVNEISSLLRENNADKYLLICSNSLTPQLIERLERQNNKRVNSIEYYGKIEFSTRLSNHYDLIKKYKLQ